MTAERVFKLYRAYKFFYASKYTEHNALGRYENITCPPLIQQRDRQFYWRISQKLNDATVHALFTVGFFFQPTAHVSTLTTPDAFSAALSFAGRAENGETLLQHDLYDLGRPYQEPGDDKDALLQTWLYSGTTPECIRQLITGDLPIDIACILLLVPQPDLHFDWAKTMDARDDMGLGASVWLDRLKKVNQLLEDQRPDWRGTAARLSTEFWHSLDADIMPLKRRRPEPSLF